MRTLLLLQLPLLLGVAFCLPWQRGVLPRLLLPAYALGLVVLVATLNKRRYLLPGLLLCTALPATYFFGRTVFHTWSHPVSRQTTDEPFTEALTRIPPGSRILLVAGENVRDYPLFAPREHYANSVMCWGKQPFDATALKNQRTITHILFEDDRQVEFHWDPSLPTAAMVQWCERQPDWESIPLTTPHQRLFRRR